MSSKKVVISCGPIPARLDSVKYLTNRFKGGLAIKTAEYLIDKGYCVTVVAWKYSEIPNRIKLKAVKAILVNDVFEYFQWFSDNAENYDAFVMAAAVANLTPVNPWEGKFPSHNYKPGDEFDIKFTIVPRAIDIIKKRNPRACVIGYKLFDASTDEELINIARHTLADAKANIIFANTPATAKTRKMAVMPDNSVVACTFEEHLELIDRAIRAEYFKTIVSPLTETEKASPEVQSAFAIVECFEKTFNGFGTVAIPAGDYGFVTTARGHKGSPVLVRVVDYTTKIIDASAKATLNAATMGIACKKGQMSVHRHFDDPNYDPDASDPSKTYYAREYVFPGTTTETQKVKDVFNMGYTSIYLPHHGYISINKIEKVDWEKYYQLFPEKYFGIPKAFADVLLKYKEGETLEVGGNKEVAAKYAYDLYVNAENAQNLSWEDVCAKRFDLTFLRNAINYLPVDALRTLIANSDRFIANTFLVPPDKKITSNEAAVRVRDKIYHALRSAVDKVFTHSFFAYDQFFYESIGLAVLPYGRNSALVIKGLDTEMIKDNLLAEYG